MDATADARLSHDAAEQLVRDVFFQQFPRALLLLAPDLGVEWASPSTATILGHPEASLLELSVADLLHPDDLAEIAPMVAAVLARAGEAVSSPTAATGIEVAARIRTASGDYRPMAVSGRIADASGRVLVLVRPAAERHALDAVLDGLASGAELSSVLCALVGLVRSQFDIGNGWILHDLDGPAEVVGSGGSPNVGDPATLLADLRADGPRGDPIVDEDRWIVPVRSATAESLYGVLVLESPRPDGPMPFDLHVLERSVNLASLAFARAADDRLLRLAASTDPLTGVLNRREFESRLARTALLPGALPLSLFFVDVDRFKVINDRFGHATGDEVLSAVAARLSNTARDGDAVGRLGGDEFAVACPSLRDDAAPAMRDRLDAAFREPIAVADSRIELSVSIGVATAGDEAELERIIDRSDADMYDRKHRSQSPTLR